MRECYTRVIAMQGIATRVIAMRVMAMQGIATRVISTRGGTRDVYVPRHGKSWSTQTRNGNIYVFLVVPRV